MTLPVWINLLSAVLIALSCAGVMGSLFYLAWKYRIKRLSAVFVLFGTLFMFGGAVNGLAVILFVTGQQAPMLMATLNAATALACVAVASFTIKCAGDALILFKRLAVWEERMTSRLRFLERQGEKDTLWKKTLTEMRDLTSRITRMAPPGV